MGAKCRRAWDINTSSKPLHDWSKKNERMNERNGCSFFVLRQLGGKRKKGIVSWVIVGMVFSFLSFHFPLVWYYTSFHVPFPFPATSSEQYITRRFTVWAPYWAWPVHSIKVSLSLSFFLAWFSPTRNKQPAIRLNNSSCSRPIERALYRNYRRTLFGIRVIQNGLLDWYLMH